MQRKSVRKRWFCPAVLCCCVVMVLTGCTTLSPTARDEQKNAIQPISSEQETQFTAVDDGQMTLYHSICNILDGTVSIYNLLTGETVAVIEDTAQEDSVEAFDYSDGVAVLRYVGEKQAVRAMEQNGVSSGALNFDVLAENCVIDLYDVLGKRTDSINISDFFKRDGMDMESFPVIDESGTKLAFTMVNAIYVIDLQNETSELINLDDGNMEGFVALTEVKFVDSNKIAFYGPAESEEQENAIFYGYVDCTDHHIYCERADYDISTMRVMGNYLCLNDVWNPITNKTSGDVIVYNCDTKKSKKYRAEGKESNFSVVNEDGTQLICVLPEEDEKQFRIRNYNLSDMQVVFEETYEFEEFANVREIVKFHETYAAIYGLTVDGEEKWGMVYAADHS